MKTVILGGGPSALGVAWGLVEAGQRDIVLLEKNAVLGGLSGSFASGDVILDYGPHRLSPEYPEIVDRFKALMGDRLMEGKNEHAVLFEKRVYRYPPAFPDLLNLQTLSLATRVLGSFLFSRFLRALSKTPDPEVAFKQHLVRKFGPALYDRVLHPLCLKVWGEPALLDPDFARLRFSIPSYLDLVRRLFFRRNKASENKFYYPTNGFQDLWDVLGDYLRKQGVDIRLNAQASSVEVGHHRVNSVTVTQGVQISTIPTDWVVSTIPTQHFMRLLEPNPFSAEELLSQRFLNRGMLLILMVVKKEKVLPARVLIAPELKYDFNRLSEQNQFSPALVPAGKAAVVADVISDVQSGLWGLSDSEVGERILNQVLSLNFFKQEELERLEVFRVPLAYPQPSSEREEAQKKFNESLESLENVLCTGRFASSDYNNSHTALKKGMLAAEPLLNKIRIKDWYRSVEAIRKTAIRD